MRENATDVVHGRVQVSTLQQTLLYIILGPGLLKPQNPEYSAAFTVEESKGGRGVRVLVAPERVA